MPMSDITDKFEAYAGFLTALSLGANIPNALSVPQFIANGFKSLLAIGSESGYNFSQLTAIMEASKNAAATVETKAAPVEEKKVEAAQEEAQDESEDASIGM